MTYDPDTRPQRDRRLATKPRQFGKRTNTVDELARMFLKSDDLQRMRRFARVRGSLDRVLGERERSKVQPVHLAAGVLTIEVADTVLLGELRTHRVTALLQALAEDRTGITRLQWRLARA